MKKCKNCKKSIDINVNKCPYCNRRQIHYNPWIIIGAVAWVAILIIIILIFTSGYRFNDDEYVSFLSLRTAIAESNVDGISEYSINQLDELKNAVRKFDKNSEWFNDYSGTFSGKNKDTDKYEITLICNGDYCAKFTVDYSGKLVNYSFVENTEKGSPIVLVDKSKE